MSQKLEKVLAKNGKLPGKSDAITVVLIVIIIALLSNIMVYFLFQSALSVLLTFWVSFLVGMVGAGVYLMVLLMTDAKLKSLQNDVIGSLSTMTILFIMSGGFVAAVTQTTTGILSATGLQGVFMVGFGWQGALSGVGASGDIRKAREDLSKNIDEVAKIKDDQIASAKNEVEDLKKRLTKLTAEK